MNKINFRDKRKIPFYIIGIALLIVLLFIVMAFATYTKQLQQFANETALQKNNASEVLKNALEFEQDQTESASSKIGKKVDELTEEKKKENEKEQAQEKEKNKTEKKTVYNIESKQGASNSIENNKTKEVLQDNTQDPVFVMPVENGEIIKKFAKDNLVYSETLEEWITHLGIDIKAEMATIVKASAAGTVRDIKNDPRYGLSVIVEHTNGYKSIYANLLTAEFVEVGENLEQGQTIGTVGNTSAFEIADPAHLHFEIIKDDENVDPEIYLKQ